MTAPRVFIVSRCAWTLYNFRRSLIQNIASEAMEVSAVGAGGDGYEDKLRGDGVNFVPIPLSMKGLDPLQDAGLLLRLVVMFYRQRPTLVHNFTIKPAIYATLAAWLAGVPVRVVTITGLGHAFMRERSFLRRVVERLYRLALARADVVFFQNRDDRDLFLARNLVAADKCRLIAGSGVDLRHFQMAPLPYRREGKITFLMIARLLREKGIAEFVAAAEQVKRRHPDAVFKLVGGVDSRNPSGLSAEAFAALNQNGAVEWLGEVSDVRPVIQSADVVVLPSYREGVPRSLLEGAAMGRALIASDAVGCKDVVADTVTGYLVPVGNAGALADACCRFCEQNARIDEMGKAARAMVAEHYDEAMVIEQTIGVYRELLTRKVGHDPPHPPRTQ
ncbi:MAG: glycosyltransferase family 4 protein [Sphingomonadales bacterium]